MKTRLIPIILLTVMAAACCSEKSVPEQTTPRVSGWDYAWMLKVKNALGEESSPFQAACEQLLNDAEEALFAGPFSVTYKSLLPPSSNNHDYMSMGPYWWPDP